MTWTPVTRAKHKGGCPAWDAPLGLGEGARPYLYHFAVQEEPPGLWASNGNRPINKYRVFPDLPT